MENIIKAFVHVKTFFPELEMVIFDNTGRWRYTNYDGEAFDFGDVDIAQEILEDASDSVPHLPFIYHPTEEEIKEFINSNKTELTSTVKDAIKDSIDENIDNLFVDVHQCICNTKSGDITPEQHNKLNKIREELFELLVEQVEQNL